MVLSISVSDACYEIPYLWLGLWYNWGNAETASSVASSISFYSRHFLDSSPDQLQLQQSQALPALCYAKHLPLLGSKPTPSHSPGLACTSWSPDLVLMSSNYQYFRCWFLQFWSHWFCQCSGGDAGGCCASIDDGMAWFISSESPAYTDICSAISNNSNYSPWIISIISSTIEFYPALIISGGGHPVCCKALLSNNF